MNNPTYNQDHRVRRRDPYKNTNSQDDLSGGTNPDPNLHVFMTLTQHWFLLYIILSRWNIFMTVFCSASMGEFPDRRKLRASDQEATGEPLDWCCVVRFGSI